MTLLRKLLQRLLSKPVTRFAIKVSSSPDRKDVFSSLTQLLTDITDNKQDKGVVVPFDMDHQKFIIFSDEHKGAGDLADDFHPAAKNYQTALEYYFDQGFTLINLGDCEELWETTPKTAVEQNRLTLLTEAKFLQVERYYRVFGNHDLEWKYAIQQNHYLKPVFGDKLKVYEGILLRTLYNGKTYEIFLTHGHQGDKQSDGNWFSKWVVAAIWTPIQRFLEVSINSVSDAYDLVDRHNIIMYDWSAINKNLLFISGHTHKPVFVSLDHVDRLNKQLLRATAANDAAAMEALEAELEKRKIEYAGKTFVKTMVHPSYFNTGCCCFIDGDITGIEIEGGFIRLVKWKKVNEEHVRVVLEESPLFYIFDQL